MKNEPVMQVSSGRVLCGPVPDPYFISDARYPTRIRFILPVPPSLVQVFLGGGRACSRLCSITNSHSRPESEILAEH